jgi:hypothetical protein
MGYGMVALTPEISFFVSMAVSQVVVMVNVLLQIMSV